MRQPHKMVNHTQTICRWQPTNCLSVFDHFVGLAFKELKRRREMLHHSSVRFYVIVVPSTINPEGKSLLIYYNRCHFAEKECLIFEINQRKSCCILSNYQLLLVAFGSSLLISMLEKFILFSFTGLITLVLLMWKWMSLLLRKNHLLRWLDCICLLNWIGFRAFSPLLKLPPRKSELCVAL